MIQLQTVTGLFDNMADAQQGVRFLLARGFMAERIGISKQTPPQPDEKKESDLSIAERTTGRFLSSLFGNRDEAGVELPVQVDAEGDMVFPGGTLVTVQVHTQLETDQVVGLLKQARVVNVSIG